MFSSAILDVAVGLSFLFLVVSLVASALTEALASLFKLRSITLLSGLKGLLNDPTGTGIVKDLYNHALINPRDNGTRDSADAAKNKPAYIDSYQFADALIELSSLVGRAPADMKHAIENDGRFDPQIARLLGGVVERAEGDLEKMRTQLASWFDNAMDRVSGVYKRKTQIFSFVAALAVVCRLRCDHSCVESQAAIGS